MTAVRDEIDITAAEWRSHDSIAAVRLAVIRAAQEHRGMVHAADVRAFLPPWVSPWVVGAYTCALVRQGYLVSTGRYRPNGDAASRNRTKVSEVRRLVKTIPAVS